MIEILKQFIILIISVFNTIFSIEIQLSDTLSVKLGIILLSVITFIILIVSVCIFFNIDFGGDDD